MYALFGLQVLHHLLHFHSLLSLGRKKRKQPTRESDEPWQTTLPCTDFTPALGQGREGQGDKGMNEGNITQFS